MRKGLVVLAVSAVVALVAASSASAKNTECNTASLTGTIEGNLIVPAGAFCGTLGATITGNVHVEEGAIGFHARASTIGGHVYSKRPIVSDIRILESTVGGNVHISNTRRGTVGAICRSHIGGNLQWSNNEGFQTIGFGVPSDVCTDTAGNTIEGSVVLNNNSGLANFDFNNNAVGGNVHVMNNTGNEAVILNTIDGVLVCEGNDPAPFSSGNTAKSFHGQCQN